jgi:hypothetical protein
VPATSPAIGAGDNDTVSTGIITDVDSYPRFVDNPTVADTGNGAAPIVDMGAYEEQSGAPGPGSGPVYLSLIVKNN